MSYDWLKAENLDSGYVLGRRAEHSGRAGLDWQHEKLRLGGELLINGQRWDYSNQTGNLPGHALFNLTAGYALTDALQLEARLDNAFDRDYQTAGGYNTPGRNVFVMLRWQGN